jgi:hypothetical protein
MRCAEGGWHTAAAAGALEAGRAAFLLGVAGVSTACLPQLADADGVKKMAHYSTEPRLTLCLPQPRLLAHVHTGPSQLRTTAHSLHTLCPAPGLCHGSLSAPRVLAHVHWTVH